MTIDRVVTIYVTHRCRIYFPAVHANAWADVRVCLACKVVPSTCSSFLDSILPLSVFPSSLSLFLCIYLSIFFPPFLSPKRRRCLSDGACFWEAAASIGRRVARATFHGSSLAIVKTGSCLELADSATHCLWRELLALSSLAPFVIRVAKTPLVCITIKRFVPMPTSRDARHRTPT